MSTSMDVVALAAHALNEPDRAEQYVRNLTDGLAEASLAMGPWENPRLIGVAASLAPLRLGRVLPPVNRARLIKRWRSDARLGGKIGVIVIGKILGIGIGTVSRDARKPLNTI